jgi:hypothetical protein
MSKQLSELTVGAKIKFGSYYGESVPWIITDKNHTGYPAGAVSLATEKIIKMVAFDGKEASNGDSNRKSYGNNRYQYANLRKWLNSDAPADQWYQAAHAADAPPTDANCNGYNGYDDQPGFLNGFTQNEKDALLSTTLTVGKATVDGGGTESVIDKIFLMSAVEVGLTGSDFTEGSQLAYFTGNDKRIAVVSQKAGDNSGYTGVTAGSAYYYWLRTPYLGTSYHVRRVNSDGTLNYSVAYSGAHGVRLACNLSSSLLISDNTDSDGCYTAIYNYAPSAPSSITVPAAIVGDLNATIQWGAATDTDGTIAGYQLERKVDSGSWTQIFDDNEHSFIDTIDQAWEQVQWRVRAYDNAGENGPYAASEVKSVIHNQPPTTDLVDGTNLGTFADAPPVIEFTVSDVDSDNVMIQFRIDGNLTNYFYADMTEGDSYTIPHNIWIKLLNGVHQLEVKLIDDHGNTVIKTLSFTKAVLKAIVTLQNPLVADERPSVILVSVTGEMPDGSDLLVEVCNNAFDEEPAWEDMTDKVKTGKKYFFTNTDKTADNWGVNIRVTLERGIATEPVFITGIGGNFA